MNTYEIRLLAEGIHHRIFVLEVNDRCQPIVLLERLQEPDRKKTFHLIKRIVDYGVPLNEQKFKDIDGSDGLFEMNPTDQVRLICFQERREYIIVLGVIKKRGRLRPQDVATAQRLRNDYLYQKKNIDE